MDVERSIAFFLLSRGPEEILQLITEIRSLQAELQEAKRVIEEKNKYLKEILKIPDVDANDYAKESLAIGS